MKKLNKYEIDWQTVPGRGLAFYEDTSTVYAEDVEDAKALAVSEISSDMHLHPSLIRVTAARRIFERKD